MIQKLKTLLGVQPEVDFKKLVAEGAQIIDVRTKGEYVSGHIKGSINIPLNEIQSQARKIMKSKPVIVCCASGMRSSSARSVLQSMGFEQVYNGGGWSSLQGKI